MSNEVISKDLLSAILTTSVALEGVFFAAFGIFYQVYATYCVAATPETPIRANIVSRLRIFCRILAFIIGLEAIGAFLAAYLLGADYGGFRTWMLVGITVIPALAIVVIAHWLAFLWME